jgi:4-hydroxy-tetrahydrodipicolinate synthase
MTDFPLIGGIFPAALTMFTADGDLDEAGTIRHVEYLVRSGAHGLVACGTSGEFIAMTNEERLRVIGWIIQAAAGRVPVYAGAGHYSTRLTIELSQAAEQAGAAGLILILPYYQKPPKEAIIRHFRTVRRETSLPLMLYNNPAYAGCVELTPRDVAALVEEGLFQSIKSTFESVVPVHDLLYLCGDRLRVFYGSFQAPLEALLAGAHGWISGFLNFLTADCVALYAACAAGDVARARLIWHKLLPFIQLYTHQVLGPVNDLAIYRAGLDLMGQYGGYSRPPFYPLAESQRALLRSLMQQAGILP